MEDGGGIWERTIEESYPYPALGADPPESDEWTAAPAFAEAESALVESHEFSKRGDRLVTRVKLRAVEIRRVDSFPYFSATFARLRGSYSMSWVRQR